MNQNHSRIDAPPTPTDRYLTVAETVAVTGISLSTIRRAITCGALPHSRVGLGRGGIRIHPTDLAEFITPRPALVARVAANPHPTPSSTP